MSDEWSDEIEAPRRKSGIPPWLLWTCGIGCAVMLVLAVVVGVGGYFLWQQMSDPEIVQPRLMKVFQADTWPEDYHAQGASIRGSGGYTVRWPDGVVMVQPMAKRSDLDRLMSPDSAANTLNRNFVTGEVEIQGRTVPMVTFTQIGGIEHLRVDLSGKEPPFYAVDLIAQDRADLDPAQLEKFLAPFDVWIGED